MRVLVFTHMYPSPQHPEYGIFIEQQVASLRQAGVDVEVLYADVKKSKWMYPGSFGPFLWRACTHRYDLVHAHYVFAGVVARSQLHLPVVLTHHGDEAFFGWQAGLCRLMSRLVERTIVVSEQIKRAIGLSSAAVIPCGVDFDLFKPSSRQWARRQLGLPAGKELVLFAGDISKRLKRFDLAKEAVAQLQAGGVDAELVLAYKQPYWKIPVYMNACDALILPSDREGSPQVVKEAMACNLPVVATDVGDVRQILAGVDGCYICEQKAPDIASKLALVLGRGQRTNGREVTQRYETGCIARRIIAVYRDTIAARRGR